MRKKFPYNLQKCTLTSSLSSCIHRYFSKVLLLLRTPVQFVETFKTTLIRGFSYVNTCLAFDSKIILPKEVDDKSKEGLKLIYKIKNSESGVYEDKRFVSRILKMDENNQFENDMTKPLAMSCIKICKKIPTQREFDPRAQSASDEDKIEHLFIADTEFDVKNAGKKHPLFNEIYTSIFEKKNVFSLNERSVFQLLDAVRLNNKGILNSFKITARSH